MENTVTRKPRVFVLGAAVSVIIVSLTGAVVMSWLLHSGHSETSAARAPKKRLAAELSVPLRDSVCASCGTVELVYVVVVKDNGTGPGVDGAGRARVGNHLRSGAGNAAPTILGTAGGRLAGDEIEKDVQMRVSYRVTVRMDDGSFRTVSQSTAPTVAVGDRVRIANAALVASS